MKVAGDVSAIFLLLSLGVFLIGWTRRFQRVALWLLQRTPRWLRGPVPLAYYESPLFLWCMRLAGLGCIAGALQVYSWALGSM